MRSAVRPRRYVARHWLLLLRPLLRYSATRDAFVLRFVGRSVGPVLRVDRRRRLRGRGARGEAFAGVERRGVSAA
jgi:hypothetical protein